MHEVSVSFPYFSGLPEDVVVNTFHFAFGGPGDPTIPDMLLLEADLQAFYAGIFTSASTAGLAPWIDLGAVVMKVYDLNDPIPRTPVWTHTSTWGMTQSGSADTAPEVALCLSYQAVKVSGLPQARRRGRLFIGGLGACVTPGTASTFPRPSTTIINNMCAAASQLLIDTTTDNWSWNVWSRVDGVGHPVEDGWVDNAFDTQRRRGQGPSTRQTWT